MDPRCRARLGVQRGWGMLGAGLEAQFSPSKSTLQLVASTPHLAPGARLVWGYQGWGPAQPGTRSAGVGSARVWGTVLGLSRVWWSC